MNNQEIFDKVVTHLITQGVPSRIQMQDSDTAVCMYRGDAGTKCAIGCLIPDDLYDPVLESRSVRSFYGMSVGHSDFHMTREQFAKFQAVTKSIVERLGIESSQEAFLAELQHTHDRHFDSVDDLT
jgi:hypothetical protein